MAILTSIKDALNAQQYKSEIEKLMEENKNLKYIKLTPTQLGMSQILAKTKELEGELEGYSNLIEIKSKDIEELNTEYNNQAVSQSKDFEQKSNEYDDLIKLKSKVLEDKSTEYDEFVENKSKEYEDLINLKEDELQQKSNEFKILMETKTQAIESLNSEYNNVKTCVDNLKSQIITLDGDILMQSFGISKPNHNLMESEKSSKMIQDIKEKQMSMIKSKEAIEFKQWIVNGDINENSQLDVATENMIRLVIRIFNDECDSIIDKVKYSNLEAIEKSIKKFFEDLNKLGHVTQVKISTKYLNTKLEELYLFYEYKLKKQEEIEEKRRIREE
ncbi:DUF4041 domain-containing protein [Clostridium sp.]|jgi:hypothetical protein|uniref:DUF4041 domain-containing protein n=1 Tax=Clostridium sp. TaxID=1506 RepID=UPI003EEEF7D1